MKKNFNDCLVSVVITTYNRNADIVKRALLSVINQTYKNIEIIVVNDYPENKNLSEKLKVMINSLNQSNIKYLSYEKNKGACYARNVGIKKAKGMYIALLDDDDEWLPQKIEKQLKAFTNDKIGMVYSPYYNVEINSNKKQLICLCNKSGNLFKNLLWNNCIGGCSMPLIKKIVFDNCGMFDESFPSLQDYDMWIRISQKYEINCVNEPLVIRYLQSDSITKNPQKKEKGFELFLEKHIDLYDNNKNALNYRYTSRANVYFNLGRFKEGMHFLKKGLNVKFFSLSNIVEPLKGILKYVKRKIKK